MGSYTYNDNKIAVLYDGVDRATQFTYNQITHSIALLLYDSYFVWLCGVFLMIAEETLTISFDFFCTTLYVAKTTYSKHIIYECLEYFGVHLYFHWLTLDNLLEIQHHARH